jgi:two-component system LytT family response regulator
MTIRTVIVDDEPLARERLRELLAPVSDVAIVGEFGDGYQAARGIEELKPDLVFLDVQMPQLSGFELLEMIGTSRLRAIIFVTAFDQYALRAFEVHAVDYLLKPFGRERFYDALDTARFHLRNAWESSLSDRIASIVEGLPPGSARHQDRLVVKSGGRFLFLKDDQIDWLESSGNYVRLHCGKDEHLIRETMSAIETKLNPRKFLRIHRSIMVNIERIREVRPWFNREHVVVLDGGRELSVSAGYRDRLLDLQRQSA